MNNITKGSKARGLVVAGLVFFGMSQASAQGMTADKLVGEWKLVSANNTRDGVTKVGSFGPNPSGMLIFTKSGRFSSVNTHPDIPKFKSGERNKGAPEEYKAVVDGSNASFGTYSVAPDGKTITFNVEGSSWPGWRGASLKRSGLLKGDEFTQTLDASVGGRSVLVYKRLK